MMVKIQEFDKSNLGVKVNRGELSDEKQEEYEAAFRVQLAKQKPVALRSVDRFDVESAIRILSRHHHRTLIPDIAEIEELSYQKWQDSVLISTMTVLQSLVIDKDKVVRRKDNLLVSKTSDSIEQSLSHGLARLVAERGSVLNHYRSLHVQQDPNLTTTPIVLAAFRLQFYSWEDYVNSYHYSTKTGITIHALLADGTMRDMFYPGTLETILKVLKS